MDTQKRRIEELPTSKDLVKKASMQDILEEVELVFS
jgi:hypothetical protein